MPAFPEAPLAADWPVLSSPCFSVPEVELVSFFMLKFEYKFVIVKIIEFAFFTFLIQLLFILL